MKGKESIPPLNRWRGWRGCVAPLNRRGGWVGCVTLHIHINATNRHKRALKGIFKRALKGKECVEGHFLYWQLILTSRPFSKPQHSILYATSFNTANALYQSKY